MKRTFSILAVSAMLVAGPALASAAQVDDAWVTMKTKVALLTSSDVHGMGLNVDTVDGVVTLHGKVETDMEKTKAESIAKGIDGVTQVKNLLQVVPESAEDATEASDDSIKAELEKRFDADQMVEDSGISIASVNDGVVLLKGSTDSMAAHV
ncbi:MAG: BON domain-containing protein, partial [Vicinamibacterales bacterium]